MNSCLKHHIIIQGVPCPNVKIESSSGKKMTELINVIKDFNSVLKNKSQRMGYGFLDVHKLTDNGDGFSNAIWHLDDIHLTPEGMQQAWHTYALQ
jgi:hypothetical protein